MKPELSGIVEETIYMSHGLMALTPHPRNVIFGAINEENCADLAKEIDLIGLENPITVNPKGRIIKGHRRWFAMTKILGWTHGPVIIKQYKDDDDELLSLLSDNSYGRIYDKLVLTQMAKLKIEILQRRSLETVERSVTKDTKRVADEMGVSPRSLRKGTRALEIANDIAEEFPEKAQEIKDALATSYEQGESVALAIKRKIDEVKNEDLTNKITNLEPVVIKIQKHDLNAEINKIYHKVGAVSRFFNSTLKSTTPKAEGKFIEEIERFFNLLESWRECNMIPCPVCGGTKKVAGLTCDNCDDGKVGKKLEEL